MGVAFFVGLCSYFLMDLSGVLSLSERFALTLDGLWRAVAARIAGGPLAAAVIVLVCGRIKRAEVRIQRLLVRFRAGRVLVRVSRVARAQGGVRGAVGARLPRRFGWLLPLVPVHAAGFASQLRGVLEEPEMMALLASVPQARRVLAPLCRMLALEPALLGVVAPVVGAERIPKVKKVRVRPEPFRMALPRGVVSAARREGFGRLR